MTNRALINALINAIGSEYFNPDDVINALKEQADAMKERGENPGSLWALANALPEIADEAKKRYLKK